MKIIKGSKLYILLNNNDEMIAQGTESDMRTLLRKKSLVGLHIKVSHEAKEQLKDLATKHKKTMTEIVLEGIELYAQKYSPK